MPAVGCVSKLNLFNMRQARQFCLQIRALTPTLVLLLHLSAPVTPFPARLFELIGQLFFSIQNMFPLPNLPRALPSFLSLLPALAFQACVIQPAILNTQGNQGAAYSDEQTEQNNQYPESSHNGNLFITGRASLAQPVFVIKTVYCYTQL